LLGYRGVVCGKCFLGERDDGILLRSTGGVSTTFFESVYISDMHVSRLDLQCTVWIENGANHLGRDARMQAAYHRATHPRDAKRKIVAWDDEDSGYTLYIGSKSSAHFCRLYNKEAESGDEYYKGAWRYEVELHNDAATDAARYLLENGLSLEQVIASTVRQYYTGRGVAVPWYTAEERNALRPLLVMESDDGRSLKWLAAQVRPTVARLLRKGYTASVIEALGLDRAIDSDTDEGH
jgi:DNA relaxase NicK